MKKPVKFIVVIVLVVIAGGFTWWQFNKKRIVRESIEKAVSKGTDNLYDIRYDSSRIDEIGGNAIFYNISLQSDSLQESLYANDTASLESTIINIRIRKLTILGANIPALLQKTKVQASAIEIDRPVITIINTGKDNIQLSGADSLALYERITGRFNSIQAGDIIIKDGSVAFANGKKSPHTTLEGINVHLANLKIDSTHDYNNIISYFIKDVVAKVKTLSTKNETNNRVLSFENIEYNAPGKFLQVDKVMEKNTSTGKVSLELSNNRIANLSTNAFILQRQIKADSLRTKGGILTLYRQKNADNTNTEQIAIDNEFFDQAFIKNISLGKTTLLIYDRNQPNAEPITIRNLEFNATGIQNVNSGTNIARLISNSSWTLSGDGVSFETKDKLYRASFGNFTVNNVRSQASIAFVNITPAMTEDAFMRSRKVQTDQYDLKFRQLFFTGLDIPKLFNERILKADVLTIQPFLHVYNDRTLPPDTSSKVGLYPHQMLLSVKLPLYIKKVIVQNGDVVYKERGAISKEAGDVTFRNVNATLTNVTNMDSYIKVNPVLTLNATAKFMGISALKTTWKLPLNTKNGEFAITGTAGAFNAVKLNAITEPLGMASIRNGTVKSLVFDMTGDNYHSKGTSTLLYNDLKIGLLKNKEDSVKRKAVVSFVANLFIRDDNPSGKTVRSNKLDIERDITRSFFNLVWKSLFAAAKKTASGKNGADK